MILLRNVKLYPDESEELLADKAAKLLHLRKSEIKSLRINKKSLDARKKNDIHYRYALALETDNEKRLLQKSNSRFSIRKRASKASALRRAAIPSNKPLNGVGFL